MKATTVLLAFSVVFQAICHVSAWRSAECPIESAEPKDQFKCIRPCDFDESRSRPRSVSPDSAMADKDSAEGASAVLSERTNETTRNGKSAPRAEAGRGNGQAKTTQSGDNFFIIFFPPKNREYEEARLKCPAGFRQTIEARRCFCERPLTTYERELIQREKCDAAFEKCRMFGEKPYDCNHIVESCPRALIRDYCIAGKVFKMRFATVVYEFCHAFLRLANSPDGRKKPYLEPEVNF